MANYSLFIDESGLADPAYKPERPYILVGCAIDDKKRSLLKEKADTLKRKYWGRTSVVFHHVDLWRDAGDFSIFKNEPEKKERFKKDLIQYLHSAPVNIFACLIDKGSTNPTWTPSTVVRKTTRSVFFDYISFLYTRNSPRGEIVIESSNSDKDIHYLDAFRYFLSPNCGHMDQDFSARDIRDVITSISFVTKRNDDNETQIADILGYAANCRYRAEAGLVSFVENSYEDRLIKLLEAKIFSSPATLGEAKAKFASKIVGYQVLP